MSSVFSGAKRKLQEVFGSRKASESAPNSPKKRKLGLDNSVSTKVQNAMARKSAEREKAAKNAAEHAAQIASRKDRALKRSRSMTVTTRRSTMYRVAPRASMPNLKSARQTAVTVKRRTLTKPSSLKSVNKPGATLDYASWISLPDNNREAGKSYKLLVAGQNLCRSYEVPAFGSTETEPARLNTTDLIHMRPNAMVTATALHPNGKITTFAVDGPRDLPDGSAEHDGSWVCPKGG